MSPSVPPTGNQEELKQVFFNHDNWQSCLQNKRVVLNLLRERLSCGTRI